MQVGLPHPSDDNQQMFRILIDTGSAEFWVPSVDCDSDEQPKNTFDPSKSSTFVDLHQDSFNIQYLDGSYAVCYAARDSVVLENLHVFSFPLSLATKVRGNSPVIDGVMGIPREDDSHSVVRYLFAHYAKLISFYYFCDFDFGDDESTVESSSVQLDESHIQSGEITIGERDPRLGFLSTTVWVDTLPSKHHWNVRVAQFKIGDEIIEIEESAQKYTIDTGSNYSFLPQNILEALFRYLGVTPPANEGDIVDYVPCNSINNKPPISIVFADGQHVVIPAKYLVLFVSKHQCIPVFDWTFAERPGRVVIGGGLLRAFYTSFDYETKRVGFAEKICGRSMNPT